MEKKHKIINKSVARRVGGKPQPKCETAMKTYGNIWTRELSFDEAGQIKRGHKHEFDHLHFLAKGSIRISVYDPKNKHVAIYVGEYKAPAWIKVPKEHYHDIIALEDDTLGYCIQAIRNENDEVVDSDYAKDDDWMKIVNKFEEENGMPDEVLMNK